MKKKAQSDIIVTILLILLAIASVAILSTVIIPIVKNNLNKAKECYEVFGKISINNELGLVCYNEVSNVITLGVTVHYGDEVSDKLKGFALEVKTDSGSNTFKIQDDNLDSFSGTISMYDDTNPLILPADNTEKTYKINMGTDIPKVVNLYPIIKSGKICDKADGIIIQNC